MIIYLSHGASGVRDPLNIDHWFIVEPRRMPATAVKTLQRHDRRVFAVEIDGGMSIECVKDIYETELASVAEDLGVEADVLRHEFTDWLSTMYGSRREMIEKGLMTHEQDARCYALYRVVKLRSACQSLFKTIDRRTLSIPEQQQRQADAERG